MDEISPRQVLASAYTMIVLTGLAIISRFFFRGLRSEPFRLEDWFMLLAFITFNVLATITIVVVPIAFEIIDVSSDLRPSDAGIVGDEAYQLKVMFASNLLFPTVLWSVKFSLMLLSKRLLYHQMGWTRLWWVMFGFVVVTYIGNWISTLSSCVPIQDYFKPGGCTSDRDVKAQVANLYYLVVAEILTDAMIMALPIMFLHQARLARTTYYRTVGIFSVGVICIVVALARGITIGTRMSVNTPTLPWILIWEMIEGGIAVIVGCLPSFAIFIIQVKKQAGTTLRTNSAQPKSREIEVGRHDNFVTRITTKLQDSFKRMTYTEDDNGHFLGGIRETRSIEVTSQSVEEARRPDPIGYSIPW